MLQASAIILSIWGGINFLLSSVILVSVTLLGKLPPMLYIVFDEPEIAGLDARVLSATKSLAILFNSSIAAVAALVLYLSWFGIAHGQRWAFWAVLIAIGIVQLFGFVADAAIGNKTMFVNVILTILYVIGIGFAGYALYGQGMH